MSRRATSAPGRRSVLVALVLTVLVGAACDGSAVQSSSPPPKPHAVVASGSTDVLLNAGRVATRTYGNQVAAVGTSFLGSIDAMQADLRAGDTDAARSDELAAQADFDALRVLDEANLINAAAVDELDTEVVPGETFAGLHAVEADLWNGRPAGSDVADLLPQASVARNLVTRVRLGPEAIGRVAVEQLDWAVDTALPQSQEHASHLGLVDVVATVGAAQRTFSTIAPLAKSVAPSLTSDVNAQFGELTTALGSLGPPQTTPDSAPVPAARLNVSRLIDATATTLARLTARLVPFGTEGMPG